MSRIARTWSLVVLAAVASAGCSGPAQEVPPEPAAAEPVAADPEPDTEPEPDPEPTEDAPAGTTPLTGLPLDEDGLAALAARPLLIVKVDNSPQARPQAGLDVADVVIEELVEGGITRFAALFHADLPDTVGPVRSGRPVDAELSSGFPTPVFAYSGARPEVQGLLRAAPIVPVEEGAPGFARLPDRRAPHDLFVAPEEVLAAGLDRGAEPLVEPVFAFSDDPPADPLGCATAEPSDDADDEVADAGNDEVADGGVADDCEDPGAAITVRMSPFSVTGWTYDEPAGVYRRDDGGVATEVMGEGTVGAANVVVLATRHHTGGCCDTAGNPYPETEVVGGDRALVLRDGNRYEAAWAKETVDAPLELVTVDGDPFPLKPGPTWLLLPPAANVPG